MSTMERVMRLMAQKNASDVYLSTQAPITIRVNGECTPVNPQPLPPGAILNLLLEVLPAAAVDELKTTGELNTATRLQGIGNYRISALRQRGTYAAVIRFISSDIPELSTLNVPPVLSKLIMEKRGLILVTGATGTGKSTTLAAMLDYRNERRHGHILTIENPIEYTFVNKLSIVNQREVGTDTASLEIGLKNALRQAADVIMIGEIRDQPTMTAAIAYAQSGHLCVGTMHANNSYRALNRILSFYPVEVRPTLLGDLAASLKSIVSQRLIPTADGAGRVPAVEILLNSSLVSELIEKGDFSGIKEAMENSIVEGTQTFEADIGRLIREKCITREDGLAFADSPTNLMWQLQNGAAPKLKPVLMPKPASKVEAPSFTAISLEMPAIKNKVGNGAPFHSGPAN
ncbi:MAG: PilT/PilU family type 4a pilus ATPase [Burkholderiaceae bacterium]|jgi:twitching motility protein PilU|nr:MAG: PilT/PilU family type 4a pilus ATPase [Burkholderiaceae bacterium]